MARTGLWLLVGVAIFATSGLVERRAVAGPAPEFPEGEGPGAALVVRGTPGRLDLRGQVCSVDGAAGITVSADRRALVIDAAAVTPGWVRVLVAPEGKDCAKATPLRVFLGGEAAWRRPEVTLSVHAESRIAEVRGPSLDGHEILAVRGGHVVDMARCVGGTACTLQLGAPFLRAWLRRQDALLVVWPTTISLGAGDPLPELQDGDGGRTRGEALAIAGGTLDFHRPLVPPRELNIAADRATIPLALPEAVADVRCWRARCARTDEGIEVYAFDPDAPSVRVQLRLAPGCARWEAGQPRDRDVVELPLVRCAMEPAAPVPLLEGVANHRYFIAIARDCFARTPSALELTTQPPTYAYVRSEVASSSAAWRLFEVMFEKVPMGVRSLELTVVHRDAVRTRLGALPIPVAGGFRPTRVRVELPQMGLVDFLPSNRDARVRLAFDEERWSEELRLEDRVGHYRVRPDEDGSYFVRAASGARGHVALRLAYAPRGLEARLGRPEPLARFDLDARYALRPVNAPLPLVRSLGGAEAVAAPAGIALAETKLGPRPLVRMYCLHGGREVEVLPGRLIAVAFDDRDGCRLVIDRSAIPEAAGEQRLRLSVDKREQILTLSRQPGSFSISLPAGEKEEFDRLTVTVAHEYSGGHYDLAPEHNIGPEAVYRVVLGDRRFRFSASTALPTGLFRFGGVGDSDTVSLSAGVRVRFAFLYRDGSEFPLGLELGVLGTGLSDTPHLSIVAGLGFSIPVLNPNTPLQTSFNIHAWAEYSPTRTGAGESEWAFLFGPSFTIGRFSATF